jgi:26S proteasome regulatory subunit N1
MYFFCTIQKHCVYFSGTSIGPNNLDSARQNLASSFVNGFVNAAFGQDKLLMEDGNKWLYKNKEHGVFALLH